MTQEYFFGTAKWVGASERTADTFSVLRGHFNVSSRKKVNLNILGLGFFKCYINGVCINEDTFLPLSSDYEKGVDPKDEVLSGHRIYVPNFDITEFVAEGDNIIDIHFGGGWYTFVKRRFGLPKAIYRVSVETESGTEYFVSDENCKIAASYVNGYYLTNLESHDYNGFDISSWQNATVTEQLITDYCTSSCPTDALIEKITPQKIGIGQSTAIYDCNKNTVGYPVLDINAKKGETVTVYFAETLKDGKLDSNHTHKQTFTVISDGKRRTVKPEFTWFGFRYFEVIGDATPLNVNVVHSKVDIASTFECDNDTLNWIYKTFVDTMRCNMHSGHPSDCPHIERRGYTGDGQVTCNAALYTLDSRDFYEKWLQDIADGQDSLSGHIQYTAPYIHSGGGPGGWGSAIVEVPYQLYKHYGDKQILLKYYYNMTRYIDYLEAHSEFGLVTSDKEGDWCLGDWCGPIILYPDKDITNAEQQVFIPAPMVNTYFMIKSLNQISEIAKIIGKDEDCDLYLEKASRRKEAMQAAYFNAFDGNFIMNIQGANSYAVDLGLGNDKTYLNMVEYYKKLGHLDTGIFATDILTRVLFEHGDANLAVDLITNNGEHGFEHWRLNGATTFHEYWDSSRSRSHNHHMFGAPVAYFFEYLLGIRQTENSAGFTSVVIEPTATSKFSFMSGSIETPRGKILVDYKKRSSAFEIKIVIPKDTKAVFKYDGKTVPLNEGENTFTV